MIDNIEELTQVETMNTVGIISNNWQLVSARSELTMGQMGQQVWVGHVGHGSVPVTHVTHD